MIQSNPFTPPGKTATQAIVVHGRNKNPMNAKKKFSNARFHRVESINHQTRMPNRGPISDIDANRQHIPLTPLSVYTHTTSPASPIELEYDASSDVGVCMNNSRLLDFREQKDAFFKQADQSPVPSERRAGFEGLAYFPPNDDLAFEVELDPVEPTEIEISTTTGDVRTYMRVATATFAVDGRPATVALYSAGHEGLFLPFRDVTSGEQTYGAGRYIDVQPGEGGAAIIDFNYAYAPFCAYSENYSCALPPAENWLDVPIRAGERIPD